jgi:hypothetical protein
VTLLNQVKIPGTLYQLKKFAIISTSSSLSSIFSYSVCTMPPTHVGSNCNSSFCVSWLLRIFLVVLVLLVVYLAYDPSEDKKSVKNTTSSITTVPLTSEELLIKSFSLMSTSLLEIMANFFN